MFRRGSGPHGILPWAMMLLVGMGSCRREASGGSPTAHAVRTAEAVADGFGPEHSGVEPHLDDGWCGGHGVPESVCTRCNAALIPLFKAAGDWCDEHGLPESQCAQCHPEVTAKWAALDPSAAAAADPPAESAAAAPVPAGRGARGPVDAAAWCFEHGVTKAACTRCDPGLIPAFKARNDWCGEHGVPESQCVQCNPECRAEWAALRPRTVIDSASGGSSIVVETDGREHRLGENDPLCQIENARIRFRDGGVVRAAGIESAAVGLRRMSAAIEVPAEVQFDATRVTRIFPRVAGIVQEVRVRVGDHVEAGALLAVMDSPVIGEARSDSIARQQDLVVASADQERVATMCAGIERMLAVATPAASAAEIEKHLEDSAIGESRARLLRAHASLQLARSTAVHLEDSAIGESRARLLRAH
ncbi:MAG TPA: efflux RND transporter periplasmic adaptor subunit, partial [Phycisphaerae bacterium]|nr:efflux RND transporter periplasmic adaptor subunit [Phycisphaerae bacterium]